jgi:hypothetical protein
LLREGRRKSSKVMERHYGSSRKKNIERLKVDEEGRLSCIKSVKPDSQVDSGTKFW